MDRTSHATCLLLGILASASIARADVRQFNASQVQLKPMPKGVVVANDSQRITATAAMGDIRRALVSIRSQRMVTRAFGGAVYQSGAAVPVRVPLHLAEVIRQAAATHGVDPRLVAAVANQESRFNAAAISPVGARGVMQLMPATAQYLGVTDSFDPRQNIFGGTRYLRKLLDTFRGDLDLTLAAYNAGPGAVAKYRGIPPYNETRNYVSSVRRSYEASLR